MTSTPQHEFRRSCQPKSISVVIPVYNEEDNIDVMFNALTDVLKNQNWELVFVDDGSSDSTFKRILNLANHNEHVLGISFSKNFGHQNALLAGMAESNGDVVITMDGDLQHPPSLIPELVHEWQDGNNIVHTKRIATNTGFLKRATSDWYYRVFSILTGVPLESGQSDFRLLDRIVVDVLSRQESGPLFFRGLIHSIGFRQTFVTFNVGKRHTGTSKYNISTMCRFATHGITAFSTLPLHIGIRLGFLTSVFAFAELIYVLIVALRGETVPGWASVAGLVSLLFGISFMLIGFLGIYIGHIFMRTQSHPLYIIENRTSREHEQSHPLYIIENRTSREHEQRANAP